MKIAYHATLLRHPVTNLAVILSAVLLATSAMAQDHLVPKYKDGSFISKDFDRLINLVLKEAFSPDVTVRALMGEHIVGIKIKDGRPQIFMLEPSVSLFSYAELDEERHEGKSEQEIVSMEDYLTLKATKPEHVPINRWSVGINPELANKIEAEWTAVLSHTRTATDEEMAVVHNAHGAGETITVDGTIYEFSDAHGGRGSAYGPDVRGNAAALTMIADDMYLACVDKTPNAFAKLRQDVNVLERRLKPEKEK
jgi:hypothetical protein